MRLALFLGLASLAPGSARIPCGPPGGPAVDRTCAAEYGGARCDFAVLSADAVTAADLAALRGRPLSVARMPWQRSFFLGRHIPRTKCFSESALSGKLVKP